MTRGAWLAVVVMTACGGSTTPPPEAPAAEEAAAAESTPPEGAEPAASEKSEDPSSDAKSGGSASGDDVLAVLQLVLDDGELEQHLHLGEPGRFPLKVAGSDLPSGLTKGTKPVSIVEAPQSKTDAVLVITKLEVDGAQATVGYSYDVEGIKGTARLKKGERGWELTSSRIVER